ncbi:MAG: MarR family winged helix-turn-helix transcriptional regulator [Pseudomonadota bacterium]
MSDDPLYDLIWMSRPLMQAAEAAVERGLVGTGLTVRMRAVLEILAAQGDLPVPDLAARLEIQRQYVQVMVNETLAAGLTRRVPNPRHARSPLIALTHEGRRLIESVMAAEARLIAQIGTGIDAGDAARALEVVRLLTERLKTLGKDTA